MVLIVSSKLCILIWARGVTILLLLDRSQILAERLPSSPSTDSQAQWRRTTFPEDTQLDLVLVSGDCKQVYREVSLVCIVCTFVLFWRTDVIL